MFSCEFDCTQKHLHMCACAYWNGHVWNPLAPFLFCQTPLRPRGVDWTFSHLQPCQIKAWLLCNGRSDSTWNCICNVRPEQECKSNTVSYYLNSLRCAWFVCLDILVVHFPCLLKLFWVLQQLICLNLLSSGLCKVSVKTGIMKPDCKNNLQYPLCTLCMTWWVNCVFHAIYLCFKQQDFSVWTETWHHTK